MAKLWHRFTELARILTAKPSDVVIIDAGRADPKQIEKLQATLAEIVRTLPDDIRAAVNPSPAGPTFRPESQ